MQRQSARHSSGRFEQAGLPYFNPHSFRKTLVQLGETTCQSPEEFKAWSQNLGHEGVCNHVLQLRRSAGASPVRDTQRRFRALVSAPIRSALRISQKP